MAVHSLRVLAILLASSVAAGDYVLPRPSSVTVTNAVVECLDPDGCNAAVACTTTPETALQDRDFGIGIELAQGEQHQTGVRAGSSEVCAIRVAGRANVTGYRYLKLRKPDDTLRYAGMVEVPLQRAGTLVNVRLADVPVEQLPMLLVIVEALVKPDAPVADLYAAATHVRTAMSKMGFAEHTDYRLIVHPRRVVVTDAEDDVLASGSSGPATNRFRKVVAEAIDYRPPKTHGLVFVGVVSEWPTGRDHGSYMYAGSDVTFVSFCNSIGFLTCSVKEDCLGHELGHAFGLEHQRHNWYGFAPTVETNDAAWRMTRCLPEPDFGWANGEWEDGLVDNLGE